MSTSHTAGRPHRVKAAERVAARLKDSGTATLRGRVVRHFRDSTYEVSMRNKLRQRVERLLGCNINVEPHYNKRGKLVALTVSRTPS